MAGSQIDTGAPIASPRVHAVDHLHVEVPLGREAAIAAFYGDLLGLKRLADLDQDGIRSIVFGNERLALRFVACERPRIVPRRRRMTLMLDSLDEVHERLIAQKRRVWTLSGLSLSERSLLTVDPFDQIIELRQSQRL